MGHIEKHNAAGHNYQLGVTAFADLKPDEFAFDHVGCMIKSEKPWSGLPYLGREEYNSNTTALPKSLDWTKKGAVTDPKNQGKCGSCWSFSTSGALEGAWKIATGKLISLSEQQLVDCAKNGNMGCQGGSMDLAFSYLEKHNVCTEDSYPYLAKQGTCHQTKCTVGVPKGSIVGFKDVSSKDMNALMQAVSKQPVSVAIEADQMAFQLYKGGILSKKCGNKLDHGVLLVGYGTENGVDYWKVVRLLLDNGADLHAREKFVGGTPLHHAALHGRTNVVNVLLERSPDLEALNRKRQTPLHVASLYGHLDTAKILLEKGGQR
ncbi:unnamed protein product [Durusdinium trenchii]|uniref:Peptidase C1A papain C-terminal domain-containing protein n=1 Tax=Durusdinium trenchii TaxID=1381693 RepID=A0ABP0NIT8_9DINO